MKCRHQGDDTPRCTSTATIRPVVDDTQHRPRHTLPAQRRNRLPDLDERLRRIVLINREHGAEFEGLWLSNTRWIDRARFPLALTPQPQERSWTPEELEFL